MEILLTNDDGYDSRGIRYLAEILKRYGKVTIVAPKEGHSGKSAAISLENPIRMAKVSSEENIDTYYCTGTPVDCVKLAISTLYRHRKPDFVFSGINHGSNAAAAVIYSGTIGAAIEGAVYEIPSIGFSITSHDTEADLSAMDTFGVRIIENFMKYPPRTDTLLNVNIPDCPAEEIKGIRFGHQGRGQWVNEFEKSIAPDGETDYMMCGHFVEKELGSETEGDYAILKRNYISVVPVKIDRTDYGEIKRLEKIWKI